MVKKEKKMGKWRSLRSGKEKDERREYLESVWPG